MRPSRLGLLLFLCLLIAAFGGACGNSSNNSNFPPGGDDSGVGEGGDDGTLDDGPNILGDDVLGDDSGGSLVIAPANKTIDVAFGAQSPTVTYSATVFGQPVGASFAIDRGEIGSIDAASGVMTPTGNVGGVAKVTATYNGKTATTQVTVSLHMTQNGGTGGDAGGGAGGNGGVGGSGAGGAVSSGTQGTLQGTPTADPGLGWLYPYDKTVWPRGLLAPLLQWTAPRNYDAVYIHLQENAFEYQGYFANVVTPFINTPVPQTAWAALGYSNQGEDVNVTLVFSSGTTAYGPLTETWKIAQGSLTGTVYYNSYGTNLALNFCCQKNGSQFGGATLAIKHGATSPVLVAGSSGGSAQCRVCHSVAAQGSTLVTQHGDAYGTSSSYNLTSGNAETPMAPGDSRFAFPALSPDGTFLFSNAGPLPGVNNASASALFSVPSGAAIPSSGLPSGLRAGSPVFSPDGKHVAYNDYSGDGISLAAMDFVQATNTFSNVVTLNTPAAGTKDLFPAFLPTNDAVVFEHETASDGEYGATRNGSRGELWWVDMATKTATALANLNGGSYLPSGPNNHNADATLDYEPTINPVPSGGYAWVVFTSRRMYGNVAQIDPFSSDPRDFDLSATPTTKKLWVAAIDLNAKAGTDPSHPAFYLPAQELLAGNSRGYWVVDPCQPNGTSCQTGDECCGGYCKDVDGGFVCSDQPPPCSNLNDKCSQTSDCCGAAQGTQCINGRCAQPNPQ